MDEDIKNRIKWFDANYTDVMERIEKSAAKVGKRAEDITLLAATKTVPAEVITHAVTSGIKVIGENKVQELCSKYDQIALPPEKIHFIGTLQTNKVHNIIGKVSMIQSVNSEKLATFISRLSIEKGITTDVLIEINIGAEASKTGADVNIAKELIHKAGEMPGIRVRGIMTIPPATDDFTELCRNFENMYNIFIDIGREKSDNIRMDILSMGMSSDFETAIQCGSNMVRLGTTLFGQRNYDRI